MDPDQELAKERHRNLTIWKEAMALVNDVYTTTKTFPKDEVWVLRLRSVARACRSPQTLQKAQSDQMTTSGDYYPIHLDLLRNLIRN